MRHHHHKRLQAELRPQRRIDAGECLQTNALQQLAPCGFSSRCGAGRAAGGGEMLALDKKHTVQVGRGIKQLA